MTGPYPQMLFSVWGTSRNDLWAVGGKNVTVGCDAGMCEGDPSPMILRFDGSTWREVQSPRASILWWVFGFSASDVWIAGERGVMLHWDGTRIVDVPTDAARNVKLFGVWGAAPNDVWAVGGVPDGSSAVLHWNGTTVSTVKDVPQVSDKVGGAWYKVWGSAADDVYLVGQSGALVHWDGKAWTPHRPLVGRRDPRAAVHGGGAPARRTCTWWAAIGQGVALHYDGVAWTRVAGLKLDTTAGLTGVCETAAGDVAITGMSGAKFVGRLGSFRDDSSLKPRDDPARGVDAVARRHLCRRWELLRGARWDHRALREVIGQAAERRGGAEEATSRRRRRGRQASGRSSTRRTRSPCHPGPW